MLDQSSAAGRIFAALGDATRLGLVERLSRGPASVSELAAPLDMSLAAVVQHLQVLEQCGLVATAKVGRVRTCQLAAAGLEPASRWIDERKALWEHRLDRLGHFLAAESPRTLPTPRRPTRPAKPSLRRKKPKS
jgi:DNA-binding transcriptional ArsR family regulator